MNEKQAKNFLKITDGIKRKNRHIRRKRSNAISTIIMYNMGRKMAEYIDNSISELVV